MSCVHQAAQGKPSSSPLQVVIDAFCVTPQPSDGGVTPVCCCQILLPYRMPESLSKILLACFTSAFRGGTSGQQDPLLPTQFHVKSQGAKEEVSEMISRGQYQLEAISAATFIAARCVGAGMLALCSPLLTLIDVLALESIALPPCKQNLPLTTPCNHPADKCLLP